MGKLLPFKPRRTPMTRRFEQLSKHYVVSLKAGKKDTVVKMTWWDDDGDAHHSWWDRETEKEVAEPSTKV